MRSVFQAKTALWEAEREKQSLKDCFEDSNKGEEGVRRPILKSLEFKKVRFQNFVKKLINSV